LKAGLCDLIAGVPTDMEMLATTRPYYRSGYVFMAGVGPAAAVRSFDDPKLRELRIGVQMIGDDFSNTPPAHALSRRGIVDNIRGYMVYGDYADAAPGASIVEALGRGDIDLAIVWGPQAGYFAKRLGEPVSLVPVEPGAGDAALPMAFDISMGVRREDKDLRREINEALVRNRKAIGAILAEYGVPRLDPVAPD
jgi:mxaJ protein